MSTYTYTTVDVPGAANTVVFGVNNLDQIVGGSSPGHGFLYSGGTFTTIDPPGSTSVDYPANGLVSISPAAVGINDAGQIVGRYDIPGSTHAFLYSGGTYTTIDVPNGVGGDAQGINNSGQIVGIYGDASGIAHGFLLSGGSYTTLDDPQATTITDATAINGSGQIVGFYTDSSGHDHGFLLSGGGYTTIDDPSGTNTIATGINDAGQIVGQYSDSNNVSHGFLYSGGTFTTIDDPLGSAGTLAFGINNAGQISGTYIDSSRVAHGFLATPDTDTMAEPPALMVPSSRLTVPAGGSTQMGITASPVDSDDKLSVTISGVPAFESITAPSGDTVTSQLVRGHAGSSTLTFTISAPVGQSISGLTLHSSFPGKGQPVNTFTVTASNSTSGEAGTSATKTITVTDPPTLSGIAPIHASGASDLVLRDVNSGAFEVNDIANNALASAYSMGAVGLEWQVAGFGNFSGQANETDMMMHNTNTGALEANNALAGASSAGAVGLNWELGRVAPESLSASAGSIDASNQAAQLVQAMAGFGGGSGAGEGLNTVPLGADTSQLTLLTTPQHA